MAKKTRKVREKRECKLLLLTELLDVKLCDGVIVVCGKAGHHLRIVAVTPGYARALSAAFARCLDQIDSGKVVSMRATKH